MLTILLSIKSSYRRTVSRKSLWAALIPHWQLHRLGADIPIDLHFQTRFFEPLYLFLSKKHGQLKAAIQAMVEQAMGWLEDIEKREGTEKWLELIETLRSVTEGKVRRFRNLSLFTRVFNVGVSFSLKRPEHASPSYSPGITNPLQKRQSQRPQPPRSP